MSLDKTISASGNQTPEEPQKEMQNETQIGKKLTALRALRWMFLLLLPASLVIGALVMLQHLDASVGLVAWLLVVGLTALMATRTLIDLSNLFGFVRAISQGKAPASPEIHSNGAAAAAALALAQMRREMRQTTRLAEEAVKSHEGVFDALPDAVIIVNSELEVVRANAAARSLFGMKLQGRDVTTVVRHPPILEALEQPEKGPQELDFMVPVPVERRFAVTVQPVSSDLAISAAMLMSFHDITTIRRLEQMRADFVANASHELRTPLSSMIGFVDTLRGPAKDDAEARERFLGIMAEQGARMANLIEDLLSLSRIELNEHTQPSSSVDLRRVITSVIEGLEPKATARKVTVTMVAPDALSNVRGEREELTQVFQNLIENALKYTNENTEVNINIAALDQGPVNMPKTAQGPVVAVAVRDHGEGIAQDHIPRLTERFYRVDSARSRQMGGTGLGLAIVKHVMNRHRGVLTIDSTIGQGSVFTAYLPVSPEPPTALHPHAAHPAILADDAPRQSTDYDRTLRP